MEKLALLKAVKELVGNSPPNINSKQLMEMLNEALKKMEIKINTYTERDSIRSV